METTDGLTILLFLSIFEIVGGAAFGASLQKLLQRDLSGCFLLLWGAGFAGIPLVIGAGLQLTHGRPVYFLAQVAILALAIVTMMVLPSDFLENIGENNSIEAGAIVGAVFFLVGGTVMLLTLRVGVGVPLFIGALFALIGAGLLIRTAVRVVRAM